MDPRTTPRPKVKPRPATGRPTGIASLAAWLGRLPLPAVKPRQDRREAWLARRDARVTIDGQPAVAPVAPEPVTSRVPAAPAATAAPAAPQPRQRPARATRPSVPGPLAFAAIPPSPIDELPDLAVLVAAADAKAEPLPAWVTAEAPRMLFEMPGPGEAVEGQEFFRLFRQNADGLAELARLAGDRPAEPAGARGADETPKDRPWWRFTAR